MATWPTTPKDWTPFEVVTAAQLDANIRDPLQLALNALVTTAGDMGYATAANVLTRLALGSKGQILRAGANAPEYYTPDIQRDYDSVSGTRATGSFGNLSGADAGPEITLAVGGLGIAIISYFVRINNSTTAGVAGVDISVDSGSPDAQDYIVSQETNILGLGMTKIFTGLSEGDHTFKLEYLSTSGTGTFSRRLISGLAL